MGVLLISPSEQDQLLHQPAGTNQLCSRNLSQVLNFYTTSFHVLLVKCLKADLDPSDGKL